MYENGFIPEGSESPDELFLDFFFFFFDFFEVSESLELEDDSHFETTGIWISSVTWRVLMATIGASIEMAMSFGSTDESGP